ncbi:MAG: hypothetical protein JWP49_421 [Phenylobacterium sp.]|nr:hypothetical protein [Phenylobacterium sp.]
MIKVPLSDIVTEQVRDLRARLARVPKGALGDKSVGPLSKGFFDVCARAGLELLAQGVQPATPGELLEAVKAADLAGLQTLVTGLQAIRAANPPGWRAWMDQGCLHAVLTRRLVLAGRMQPSEV